MSKDTIYRQDAIDAFWKLEAELRPSAIDAVLDMLKNLPSAQPERKKGKWLRSGSDIFPYECDQCGDTNERSAPWCPNCGCRMEEGDAK